MMLINFFMQVFGKLYIRGRHGQGPGHQHQTQGHRALGVHPGKRKVFLIFFSNSFHIRELTVISALEGRGRAKPAKIWRRKITTYSQYIVSYKDLIIIICSMKDDERLRDERKKAKKNKDKYIGMSSDSMGFRLMKIILLSF